MLYFIGLGLNVKQLTKEAEFALKNAKTIYVEVYTSMYSEGSLEELEKISGKEIIKIYRDETETNFEKIIESAKNEIIAFCVFGNITSATTHSILISDCIQNQIEYKLIPGISIFSVIPMLTGLQEYRFGRTVSIVKPLENYAPTSFIDWIIDNKQRGLHTLCLSDIKIDEKNNYLMQPFESAKRIIEVALEKQIDARLWKCIAITGACSNRQLVYYTDLGKLEQFITDYDVPSSIVILGNLQMDEEEFISNLDKY